MLGIPQYYDAIAAKYGTSPEAPECVVRRIYAPPNVTYHVSTRLIKSCLKLIQYSTIWCIYLTKGSFHDKIKHAGKPRGKEASG